MIQQDFPEADLSAGVVEFCCFYLKPREKIIYLLPYSEINLITLLTIFLIILFY